MKPTQPGWYWLRQNYVPLVGDKNPIKAKWECGLVFLSLRKRQRKGALHLHVATVMFGGFCGPIDELPDYWDWSGPIEEPPQ